MDPVTAFQAGTAIVGLITQFMGHQDTNTGYDTMQQGSKQINAGAVAYNEAQRQQIGLEQQVEGQRRQWMEMDSRRKSLENLRASQRARATALTNAAGQGASYGSGLQGGYSQISGESAWNAQGNSNSLEIGRNTFDLNAMISQSKISMANASLLMQQGQLTTQRGQQEVQKGQGKSSLGSSIVGSAGGLGRLAGQFFPGKSTVPQNIYEPGPSYFNPGGSGMG